MQVWMGHVVFFFFKQKTAYEMRISDWSADVCSSDLSGSRIALLAFGAMVPAAEQIGGELDLTVVNMRFVKPLDRELVLELARSHDGFATIEDNVVMGGAGSAVAELLNESGVLLPILQLGLPDAFQHHGKIGRAHV